MDDQASIEQDIDCVDRFWRENLAWRIDHSGVMEKKGKAQEGFIGYINKNHLLISIPTFIIGGIAFYIVSLILI